MTYFQTHLEGHAVEVEFDGNPIATPARLFGPPEDCYPAEGGEVEITAVHLIGPGFVSTDGWSWQRAKGGVQMNVIDLLSIDQLETLTQEILDYDWKAEEAA